MNAKLTVSIGIPAYNEEANIKRLIKSLLAQRGDNFELVEIIVVSDGSADNTISEVRSIASPLVTVIEHADRKGQATRQNEILRLFKGDVLILLNGDVLPEHDTLIQNAIRNYMSQSHVGIIGLAHKTLPGRNFFERVMNFSMNLKTSMFQSLDSGDTFYNCRGGGRLFSRAFAKEFTWRPIITEDVYSYCMCKKLGYTFAFAKDAAILYRSPDNMRDHVRQSARFNQGWAMLAKDEVCADTIEQNKIPPALLLKAAVKGFLRHPIFFIAYALIVVRAWWLAKFTNQNVAKFDVATSSKQLLDR